MPEGGSTVILPNFVLRIPTLLEPYMVQMPGTGTQRATFSKSERLCGRLRMKEVITTGRTVREEPIRLVGKKMALPTAAPAQVAFSVPRRFMRRAVQRNRMRRLMREAWRLHKHPYQEKLRSQNAQCAWLFIYQGRELLSFSATRTKITRSLDRWMNDNG